MDSKHTQLDNTIKLSEWVELYTRELYSWALNKVSDKELAEDLVQDTFLAAAEKIGSFKADSSPKTWLFAILNHKIIDVYRKKVQQPINIDNTVYTNFFDEKGTWRSDKRPLDWQVEEDQLLDDNEFHEALTKCLEALPEKWNLCVKLKYLMNKDGEEICRELGITPANFWQIIHRAKLQLRDCIENNWFKK
jgi:RNA polymerase sigma-70 factor (TIGR02943 family)